jgi:hypothetical protein
MDLCHFILRKLYSSAGPARGIFYSCFTTQRNFWACITAKSSDCPHIVSESIEMDREQFGEHSPIFRNKHLAEFCGDDELSFIPPEAVPLYVDDPPEFEQRGSGAFVDWPASSRRIESIELTRTLLVLVAQCAINDRNPVPKPDLTR